VLSKVLALTLLTVTLHSPHAEADSGKSSKDTHIEMSPNKPWTDLPSSRSVRNKEEKYRPTWQKVLLFVPNRFLDLIDIVKADVGVGPAYGGVVRLTRYGQVGYRSMDPLSLRAGLFGRDWPVEMETDNEFGAGPLFHQSRDREVCHGELGAGVDLFLVGAYGGVCAEEVIDFLLGFVFLDVMQDDV